ncbi:MAG: DUF4402 domain-containing protein [Mariniphaga sp.]
MKTCIHLILSVLMFWVAQVSEAKAQASVQATANAEVIEALTSTETAQMNFGRFSPETQGGKIILTPDGVRTAQGTVVLGGGTHNSASFYLTGQYEATFSVTLPSGPAILTNLKNNKTMEITDWTSIPAPGIGVGKLTGGSMTVRVGAVLNVGDFNANPVGIYAGIYAITFAYN